MSNTQGSSARDHRDGALAAAPDELAVSLPDDLPENVIPLRPPGLIRADNTVAVADQGTKPTPIFGRAAINLPEWPTVLIFAALSVSVLVLLLDSFRRGALLFAASMALAFFFRAVLTDREAGMLRVRSRAVDLVVLGMFTASIGLLAIWVPAPS